MWYKVKKRYVGAQQVRPNYWEYNFAGKTIAQVQSDWWFWDNISYYWIDTYWLYWNNSYWIYHNFPLNLASAKKVVFTVNWRLWTSWDQNHNVWISTSSTKYKATWYYVSYSSNWCFLVLWTGWNNFTNTSISWTDFSYIGTIDFVNKQIKIQFTKWNSNSFTQSLSDAQITDIRTSSFINVWLSDTSTARLSYFKIAVEN